MSLHIIIDGYNLIRNSPSLKELDRRDIQLGREALVDRLASYRKIKPHRITVVFDGISAPAFSSGKETVKGIQIVFSRQGQTADSVIKKMARKEREKAVVVSSDREIIASATSSRSATLSVEAFEDRLLMADYAALKGDEDGNAGGWVPTTKKKGPSKRLSKSKRRNRKKIRKL
jgi:predicted RNA-binding protein with PIN domain